MATTLESGYLGPVPRCAQLAALAALAALLAAMPAGASPYSAVPAPYRAAPRFSATYVGSGTWRTYYHATPPNPGGAPDSNYAHDSSAESWRLGFATELALAGASDQSLTSTAGRALVLGRIDHTHVDGLYTELDASVSCQVKGATSGSGAHATLAFRRSGPRVVLTAGNPLGDALTNMPTACPDQGDSIDRILDNYFTPGFSLAPGFGPDLWFASRPVSIPLRVLRRSAWIAIALRGDPSGRPPTDCAPAHPEYESCITGGTWTGLLTLRRTR